MPPQEMLPQEMPQPGGMPQEPQGVPAMDPGSQPISDEKRQELLSMIEDLQGKLGNLKSGYFASRNKNKGDQSEILNQIFHILRLAGVDLNNRESVMEFIEKLRAKSPELAKAFEAAMEYFISGAEAEPLSPQGGIEMPEPFDGMSEEGLDENNNEIINENEELPEKI